MAVDTFAAINVGSFELELGIYEISARSGIRQIDRMRHVISLGSETYKNGKISYGMVEELCQVLYEGKDIRQAVEELMGRPSRHENEQVWLKEKKG